MGSKYLKKSPTGWYSYRRRIPERLQKVLGKREFKQRLETKDETVALARLGQVNAKACAQLENAEKQLGIKTPKTSVETLAAARDMLLREGLHPDQQPTLPAEYTKEEYDNFQKARSEWLDQKFLFDGIFQESQTIEQGWTPKYKKNDPTDVWQAAESILSGEAKSSAEITWQQAVETYFPINKQAKRRDPHDQQKFETKTRNLFNKFAAFIGGEDTKLKDITRANARAFLDTYRQGPKPAKEGTIGRYSSQIGAVFNVARKEFMDATIANPFEGLRNSAAEHDDATKRRSFTPAELIQYEQCLRNKQQPELQLIGLLMIYTGCRTSEASGLQVRDIDLLSNAPNVKFRDNKIRRLDKKGLSRTVPLATPLLDALREYDMPDDPQAPLFGKYSPRSAADNVSIQLNSLIRHQLGITDPRLVSYSTRHTFKTRGKAARVEDPVIDYLQGHKSEYSTRIAQKYSDGLLPEAFRNDLQRILETENWAVLEE